jgi:hypothetical protein
MRAQEGMTNATRVPGRGGEALNSESLALMIGGVQLDVGKARFREYPASALTLTGSLGMSSNVAKNFSKIASTKLEFHKTPRKTHLTRSRPFAQEGLQTVPRSAMAENLEHFLGNHARRFQRR